MVSKIRLLRLRGLFRNRGRLLGRVLFFIVAVRSFSDDFQEIGEAHLLRWNHPDFTTGCDGSTVGTCSA